MRISKAVLVLCTITVAEMAHLQYMYTAKSGRPQAAGYVFENGASKTFFQLGDTPSHHFQVVHHNSAPAPSQGEPVSKKDTESKKGTASSNAGVEYNSHHNQMSHGFKPVVENVDATAKAKGAAAESYHGKPNFAVSQANHQNTDVTGKGPQVFNKGYNYEESKHHSNGEKDSSGYKSLKNYDNGSSKKSNDFDKKSHYNNEGAHKTKSFDESDSFKNYDNSNNYKKANEFASKKSHKKGHKTSGFKNSYHKDEYKKEHLFYDDADDSGFYKKDGAKSYKHSGDEGSKEHHGHGDSSHGHSSYGKKGSSDKAASSNKDTGFENKYGADSFYNSGQSFGKKTSDFSGHGKY